MSCRRLLRRGLLSAALLGAASLAPIAAAKPPDLPSEVKNEATPAAQPAAEDPEGLLEPPGAPRTFQSPAEPQLIEQLERQQAPATNPTTNSAGNNVILGCCGMPVEAEPTESRFMRLHLANRKLMTSCFLFGVHPLLALTPADRVMYLPEEMREALEEAALDEADKGSLIGNGFVNDQPRIVRIGQILIVGNDRTRDCVILRQLEKSNIWPGQVLEYPSLRLAERNLARLGIFEATLDQHPTVRVLKPESDPNCQFKDILVTVKEDYTGTGVVDVCPTGIAIGAGCAGAALGAAGQVPIAGAVVGAAAGTMIGVVGRAKEGDLKTVIVTLWEGNTGSIVSGVGFNSDAGICGSIVLPDPGFAGVPSACGAGEGAVPGGLIGCVANPPRMAGAVIAAAVGSDVPQPGGPLTLEQIRDLTNNNISDTAIIDQIRQTRTVYQLTPEQITWLHKAGVSDPVISYMANTGKGPTRVVYADPVPKQAPVRGTASTTCTRFNTPVNRSTLVFAGPERTVLDNLQALEDGDRLLESAKEMLRTGRMCEALDLCEKLSRLCAGSRYDEMAHALATEALKLLPGGAEEAEEGAQQTEEEYNHGFWQQLLNWFQRDSEAIGEKAAETQGTPIWLILSDLFSGQGLNLFPQKPQCPAQGEEEQDTPTLEIRKKEIARHLNMPVTLSYRNVALRDVLQDISRAFGLKIRVDEDAISRIQVGAANNLTLTVNQMPLDGALRLLLKNRGLTYVVKGDEICVTSRMSDEEWWSQESHAVLRTHVDPGSVPGAAPAITNGCVEPGACPCVAGTISLSFTGGGLVPTGAAPTIINGCVEPGAQVMADGFLKAARLAMEQGNFGQAGDLARQAFALDPQRMMTDGSQHRLYLLAQLSAGARINAICPCPDDCVPVCRPGMPGVEPRVVAALKKVLAETAAKHKRAVLVVEEEQEPRTVPQSVEVREPLVLERTKYRHCKDTMALRKAWASICDQVSTDDCAELLEQVLNFRLSIVLEPKEGGKTWALSYGLLGWSVEEMTADDDD